jgi:hypothetical protein
MLDMARFMPGNAMRQDRHHHEHKRGGGEGLDLWHANHSAGALNGRRASKYLQAAEAGLIGEPFRPAISLYFEQMNFDFSATRKEQREQTSPTGPVPGNEAKQPSFAVLPTDRIGISLSM